MQGGCDSGTIAIDHHGHDETCQQSSLFACQDREVGEFDLGDKELLIIKTASAHDGLRLGPIDEWLPLFERFFWRTMQNEWKRNFEPELFDSDHHRHLFFSPTLLEAHEEGKVASDRLGRMSVIESNHIYRHSRSNFFSFTFFGID